MEYSKSFLNTYIFKVKNIGRVAQLDRVLAPKPQAHFPLQYPPIHKSSIKLILFNIADTKVIILNSPLSLILFLLS